MANWTEIVISSVLGSSLIGSSFTPKQPSVEPRLRFGNKILVGAIRWDAWHGDRSEVGRAVERSLGPSKWHGRLPFYATVIAEDEVRIDGASQKIVDEEIQLADRAGLDYWAYLLYDEKSAMNLALNYYLASRVQSKLRFCVILEVAHWKTRELAQLQTEQTVRLMLRSEYQKTAGGRPLLYLLAPEPDNKSWGARQGQAALGQLRRQLRSKGVASPFIVVQDYRPQRANILREQWKADAISAYAYQRNDKGASYRLLAHETTQFWEDCKNTGSSVVPIVMTGWDRRPRIERPIFWETWQKPNVGLEEFYHAAKPSELADHLEEAMVWVKTHPRADPAKTVLIYAWNENDEGGWLVPTVGEGAARLDAVRTVLRHLGHLGQ